MQTHSKSVVGLAETSNFIETEILSCLDYSRFVVFRGDMGAGKTTLIKKICNFLKVNESVSSPTFSLVNEYSTAEGEVVYHFDFYRINDVEEAFDFGVEEYFDSEAICLLEWAEKVEELLPEKRVEIQIGLTLDAEKREYTISLHP
jgi:tRNA threonylcarbamoyladenosine biosynthesis protein TsaE